VENKLANRNTVLAFFIPNKLLSLIETCHELISQRLSNRFREWNPKSRRNWNACNLADKTYVNPNFDTTHFDLKSWILLRNVGDFQILVVFLHMSRINLPSII
jgi:hypothetical protein